MITLTGKHIKLRSLEPTDLAFLYQIENDESFWEVSNTQKPFSKHLLQQYLENAQQDIYQAKQLRLLIEELKTSSSVGFIDMFDFDPKNKRAGIGIVISLSFQNRGFASESLKQLIKYCFSILDVHQLHANITEENTNSIKLFEKLGFKKSGLNKDWIFSNGVYKNVLTYQLIHE